MSNITLYVCKEVPPVGIVLLSTEIQFTFVLIVKELQVAQECALA
jgi:hypothetical protein